VELKEFVTESIIQITKGITKAQEDLKEEWVRINPKPNAGVNVISPMLYTAENGAGVFPLTFDVAVSAEDKEGGGGFGIKVLNVGVNFKDGSQESKSTISRVTFSVPIAYPLKKLSDE
jgi:hypothetical protein